MVYFVLFASSKGQNLKNSQSGWIDSYFQQIGLEDFVSEKYERIGGNRIENMGKPVGELTHLAAEQLGLPQSTKVAVGIIDAHAGGIGTVQRYFLFAFLAQEFLFSPSNSFIFSKQLFSQHEFFYYYFIILLFYYFFFITKARSQIWT